ncbi:serine hydrolase domain-containing protein [Luteimonas sp. FCS-9]|uniref:serine hydrolase domain-containing protein n=1 Tax=Luteimonas sp. FCS-9 TaxID=1547516 RepID=UPI00063E9E63|nr:serine hydrolase domain-containing protein [Luteimonas sp. FCS-9]KLI98624.1 hypothetical protein WQ56_14640 [Luteimonas sp. FCS-9]
MTAHAHGASGGAWPHRLRRWLLAGAVAMGAAAAAAQAPDVDAPAGLPAGAVPAPVDATAGRLDPARVAAWLDGIVPYLLEQGDLAGAVVTVVERDRVVVERGYGLADVAAGTPVDPAATLFRPGSISKLFVWTAVMQLVEQGRLDLDADIDGYLDVAVSRGGTPITLRHVMTHTTGLEERLRHLIVLGPDHPSSDRAFLLDWVPARIAEPGTRPAYSNYATGLAARIVERVSGSSFEDYAQRHILAPLGMRHASFHQQLPPALAGDAARGYLLGSGEAYPAEKVTSPGVGGLYVSGGDMSRFMRAFLQGGTLDGQRILAADTVATMFAPQPGRPEPLAPMGLGWITSHSGGYPVVSHGGTSLFFYSWLYLLPEQGIGVYLSTNSAGRDRAGAQLRGQVFERFVETFLPPRPVADVVPTVDAATAAAHAAALAAVDWRSTRRSDSSFLRLGDLLSPFRVTRHDDGTIALDLLRDAAGTPLRWRETAPWMWQEVGGRQRLAAIVEDDRPVYFSAEPLSAIMGFEPVPAWRSARWLGPASGLALLVLLGTAAVRGAAVPIRRRYRVAAPATGSLRRLQTVAALLPPMAAVGWVVYLGVLDSTPDGLLDPSLVALACMRVMAWLALAAVPALAWVAWRQPAHWPRPVRLWSWVLVLAAAVITWGVLVHGLASPGSGY